LCAVQALSLSCTLSSWAFCCCNGRQESLQQEKHVTASRRPWYMLTPCCDVVSLLSGSCTQPHGRRFMLGCDETVRYLRCTAVPVLHCALRLQRTLAPSGSPAMLPAELAVQKSLQATMQDIPAMTSNTQLELIIHEKQAVRSVDR
jgi:hypothetical protein